MNKRHKLITVLLVIMLSVALAVTLIACDNDSYESTAKDTGEFISNGNFVLTSSSGNSFPKVPSSWTGSAGSSATNNATDTDNKSLVSGVVNTEKSAYNSNKGGWSNLSNPYKHGEDDDNVLMIYNKKDNSYKYTSSSFSIDAGKYYHVSAWVKTAKFTGSAYVIIAGDAYHEFEISDTKGEWVNVSMYLQTSDVSSNSLSVILSNGRFGKNDGNLSSGYVFFDDVTVTELSDIEGGKTAEQQFGEITVSDNVAKQSLTLGDSSFININNTLSQPHTPANWSGTTSSGENGTAPTGSDHLEKGIFDLDQPTSGVNTNVTPIGADAYVLGIHAKQNTAYSYRSSKKIRFESNGYYKLTINVNTFIEDNIPDNAGAFLRIKSTTGTDDILAEIDGINTNGKWNTATLYIKADQRKNLDLYVEVGFGKGGKENLENVKGQAYFDNLALEEITEEQYNSPTGDFFAKEAIGTELDPANNTINNPSFDSEINSADWYKGVYGKNDNIADAAAIQRLDTKNWNDLNGTNPLTPNDSTSFVMAIRNAVPTVSKVGHKIETAGANKYYRLGFWVKTTDIPKGKGLTATLYKYDKSLLDPVSQYTGSSLASISGFNTASLESAENDNGYTELVFLIEGDTVKDNEYYLEFSLGSGTFFTANTHVIGNAYITDVSLYPISYSDYQSESGTYVKKYSFKSSSGTIANSDFNNVNVSDTMDAYEIENYYSTAEGEKGLYDAEGNRNYFGLPTGWSASDKSYLNVLNAGIVNSNNNTLLSGLGVNTSGLYKGLDKVFGPDVKTINPNLLVIGTKEGDDNNKLTVPTNVSVCGCTCEKCVTQGFCDGNECDEDCGCLHTGYAGSIKNTWGFSSPSISLGANSYYKVSVWARLFNGNASITLKPSSKVDVKSVSITDKVSGWQEYSFYVETGFDSTSVNLSLTLGDVNDKNAASYNGLVMFDMPTLTTIDSEAYEAAVNTSEYTTVSYTYTTFDNTTQNDESLDTPTGWTGENTDEDAPKKDTEQAYGVYNRDHGNRNWLGADDNSIIEESELLEILNGKTSDGKGGFTYNTPDNDNVLVINNKVASEYTYSNTLARSLDKSGFYEISIRVLTKDIAGNKNATIKLDLNNNHFTFGLNEEKGIKVNTDGAWTTYTFYISTPDEKSISTVTINLSLGLADEDNYVQGYAFFDDVRIAKLNDIDSAEDFDEFTKDINASNTMKIVLSNDDADKEEEAPEEVKSDPLLWLYITSGVIGGLIVIVVIVFLFKKFYKPRKKNFKKDAPSYSRDVSKTKSDSKAKDVKKTYKD